MPRREKTPPPSGDEPKYFTVVHPWPGHLDLSLPGDGKHMCKWLAAACGTTDPVLSYFYRPDSPGLCIIEIAKDWAEQHARRLLGCHSWHAFLRDKSNTANNATSVFYSHYRSHREVQKMGWKTVDLSDSWFDTPEKRAMDFVKPYPLSTWCPLPAHDTTGHSFCRTLPVNLFPEGNFANTLAVPVGSQAWINKKAIAPAPVLPKESRPTSEPLIPSVYDEDWGPTGSIIQSNEAPNVEDLWGDPVEADETELISDLAIASFDSPDNVRAMCPDHGKTCKKGLCQWRADHAKEEEKEHGYPKGPSNTKNYKKRPNYSRGRGGTPNDSNRGGDPTSPTSPVRDSPRGRGAPPSVWSRGAPPNMWSRGPPQGNGTGRGGQPAWAPVRGRRPA